MKKIIIIIINNRVAPRDVDVGWLQPLINALITIMGDVKFLRNPYVRGQLAEILRVLFPEEGPTSSFLTLFENPVVLKTLLPALIQLYVDIESTGRNSQFEEKFGVRRLGEKNIHVLCYFYFFLNHLFIYLFNTNLGILQFY